MPEPEAAAEPTLSQRARYVGLQNQDVAELAGVNENTVSRLFASESEDRVAGRKDTHDKIEAAIATVEQARLTHLIRLHPQAARTALSVLRSAA